MVDRLFIERKLREEQLQLAQKIRSRAIPVSGFFVPTSPLQEIVHQNLAENVWLTDIECKVNHKKVFITAICSKKPELIESLPYHTKT